MKIILILAVIILVANLSYALDVETYKADFNIVGDKAVVELTVLFNEKINEVIKFDLPEDYEALSVYIDSKPVSPKVEDNVLMLELKDNSLVKFNYVTKEFIDKTNFLMNMKLDFNTNKLLIKLVLPKGATLRKPITEGDLTSGSIYPRPSKASTDGQSLIFYWLKKEVKEGDEISIFTQIEPKKNPLNWIILIIVLLLAGLVIFIYMLRKKPKTKVIVTKPQPKVIVEKEDMVEKHLKEDEEIIVNVLKLKEDSCEQGTLRVATGFSKATLSRLLKELEDRKIIYKEKRGKKNLVFLKK